MLKRKLKIIEGICNTQKNRPEHKSRTLFCKAQIIMLQGKVVNKDLAEKYKGLAKIMCNNIKSIPEANKKLQKVNGQ